MALIRATSGSGGSGSGLCAMIHMDRASNYCRVFANSQTDYKAANKSMGSGTFTLTVDGLGTIVIDTTNTDYGCKVDITPTKNFNYRKTAAQTVVTETMSSETGTFVAGQTYTFIMYYYNQSASRPAQIDLLLWE